MCVQSPYVLCKASLYRCFAKPPHSKGFVKHPHICKKNDRNVCKAPPSSFVKPTLYWGFAKPPLYRGFGKPHLYRGFMKHNHICRKRPNYAYVHMYMCKSPQGLCKASPE